MMRNERAGMSLVELIVAIAVITTLLVTVAQMLGVVAAQLRRNRERLAAIENAANLMELITAQPGPPLGQETLQVPEVRDWVERTLDRWSVDLRVTPLEEPPAGQRIELRLRRQGAVADEPPLKLTAWRYHPELSPP